MNLVLDFGNTTQKMAILNGKEEVDFVRKTTLTHKDVISFVNNHKACNVQNAILANVVPVDSKVQLFLEANFNFILLNAQTPIPIVNKYQTPQTLGPDRLAVAIGGNALFPQKDVLVIQMGSCITFDFVNSKAEYLGGSISPGMMMRLNALNVFSAQLPMVEPLWTNSLMGDNTETAILTGVMQGIIDECNGKIERYKREYPNVQIILTGGDANMFKNSIKNEIFAYPNLVMFGLNRILDYNVEK
ncbi:MAG: type III pantothenate kinase [Bacteroidales bacterium]|nr:type III pantothenate kinase [Bacteroidales bacterium]